MKKSRFTEEQTAYAMKRMATVFEDVPEQNAEIARIGFRLRCPYVIIGP